MEKGADAKKVYQRDVVEEIISNTIRDAGGSLEKAAYALNTTPDHLLEEAQRYNKTYLLTRENS